MYEQYISAGRATARVVLLQWMVSKLVEVDTNIVFVAAASAPTQDCAARSLELSRWKIHLAIGLRTLAGGSYLDVAARFGVSHSSAYTIMWAVVDAINNTPEVGPFFFPRDAM